MNQVEYLTKLLMSQLGITEDILTGTANEQTMLNYYSRVIEPILSALTDEMRRKFLTKTARTQGQSIMFFRDPFKLVPVNNIADIADKFTRNEILTSNEVRGIIGFRPSNDPSADELRNKNLNHAKEEMVQPTYEYEDSEALDELDEFDDELNELEYELNHEDDDDSIAHYSSPYYDPVKAHEYYEAHKKLKGRKSTAGLNDEGKAAAKYVKERLTEEKKSKISSDKDRTDSLIERHSSQMKSAISGLREKLKGMSKADKLANRDNIQAQISRLREQNQRTRESLRSGHKDYRIKTNEEYDAKYENELSKIRSESQFQKVKKSRSR